MGRFRDMLRLRSAMKDFTRSQEEAGTLPTTSDWLFRREEATARYLDPANLEALQKAALEMGADPRIVAGGDVDKETQVTRLTALRESGVLTEAEFEREKARVLGS